MCIHHDLPVLFLITIVYFTPNKKPNKILRMLIVQALEAKIGENSFQTLFWVTIQDWTLKKCSAI